MARHSIVRSPRRWADSGRDTERGDGSDDGWQRRFGHLGRGGFGRGDTHLDLHVAVALDQLGRRLGALTVPTTVMGYKNLLSWAEGFGPVRGAGVEGTGSYGAGLARHFKTAGIPVMEVERPKRRHLRRNGKSDPLDAEAAARAVLAGELAGETAGEPKSGDGRVEMIRALLKDGPPLGGEGEKSGRQPAPSPCGDGAGNATEALARAFYQGARSCYSSVSPWVRSR
jgi:Transposase